MTGPAQNEGNACAALVEKSFASTIRRIVSNFFMLQFGNVQPAIVRSENDDGIAGQIQRVESLQQTSHGVIQGFDERRIDRFKRVPVFFNQIGSCRIRDVR